MRSFTVIILLAFIAKAHANESAKCAQASGKLLQQPLLLGSSPSWLRSSPLASPAHPLSRVEDLLMNSISKLVDSVVTTLETASMDDTFTAALDEESVDGFVNNLFDRVHKASTHHAALDNTTLGKSDSISKLDDKSIGIFASSIFDDALRATSLHQEDLDDTTLGKSWRPGEDLSKSDEKSVDAFVDMLFNHVLKLSPFRTKQDDVVDAMVDNLVDILFNQFSPFDHVDLGGAMLGKPSNLQLSSRASPPRLSSLIPRSLYPNQISKLRATRNGPHHAMGHSWHYFARPRSAVVTGTVSRSSGILMPEPNDTRKEELHELEETSQSKSPGGPLSQWHRSVADMKRNPWPFIAIPFVAAAVGYITNWVGVQMLFYPIHWRGIPLKLYPEEPFGWLGWQGIVPAKRFKMANKMVDVTITKLLDVKEVFSRLSPKQLRDLLLPTLQPHILGGWCPKIFSGFFLRRACKVIIKRAEEVVDIRSLVVSGLTNAPTTLGAFFQTVGRKELDFLINSGFGIGFLFGILQLLQWMLYPALWTLPAGGALVGYITNWIALKWIFAPLVPTKVGPFVLLGMFLQRQPEVAEQFSEYIAGVTLCSQRVWNDVLNGPHKAVFTSLVNSRIPLPRKSIQSLVEVLRESVTGAAGESHPLHPYCNTALALRGTLETKMKAMSTAEFEQVLHPIFQEDELTLILAGAVLGAAAGAMQLLWTEPANQDDKNGTSELSVSNGEQLKIIRSNVVKFTRSIVNRITGRGTPQPD